MIVKNTWFTARLILLFIVLSSSTIVAHAQCAEEIKSACLSQFDDLFVHDGNSSITEMKAGDTAELFKTFFAGQTYRMVVCKDENIPPLHVKIVNGDGNVLFDNKDKEFELVWDFAVKGTQKLIVQLEVLRTTDDDKNKLKGCVAILFGLERNK